MLGAPPECQLVYLAEYIATFATLLAPATSSPTPSPAPLHFSSACRATCGKLQNQTTCSCRRRVYTVTSAGTLSTFSSASTAAVVVLPGATCGSVRRPTTCGCRTSTQLSGGSCRHRRGPEKLPRYSLICLSAPPHNKAARHWW